MMGQFTIHIKPCMEIHEFLVFGLALWCKDYIQVLKLC